MARSFYEDDSPVINKPGTITPISPELKAEDLPHGEVEYVDGMIIRTTPKLEQWTRRFRTYFNGKFQIFDAELDTQKSAFANEWSNLKHQYHEIVKEPVLPSGIYILTAALTGSILVRHKNIAVRFITPVLFGGAATKYFMPRSFDNLFEKYENLEKQYVPQVYDKRVYFIKDMRDIKNGLDESRIKLNDCVISQVHDWRKQVKDIFNDGVDEKDEKK